MRIYGVVLASRCGRVMVKVEYSSMKGARQWVQAEIPAWRLGRVRGGNAYTTSFVRPLAEFAPEYAAKFISLSDAVARVAADGYIDMRDAS
jgi:hypothetical protein